MKKMEVGNTDWGFLMEGDSAPQIRTLHSIPFDVIAITLTLLERLPFSIFSNPRASTHSAECPSTSRLASSRAVDPVEQALLTWREGGREGEREGGREGGERGREREGGREGGSKRDQGRNIKWSTPQISYPKGSD
jgi:hypothetical protein